ncbi:MAG: hypothetical protein QW645_05030, partial [Candidatus Bathyarchaeia archaeon]
SAYFAEISLSLIFLAEKGLEMGPIRPEFEKLDLFDFNQDFKRAPSRPLPPIGGVNGVIIAPLRIHMAPEAGR